ncbi:MAG: 50S ribosomal protein L21 [Leptolyngbya sp. SIO3F4]|nr:50S ribosomal protein L21 [Leptolyngbya sp. SIO3F4]
MAYAIIEASGTQLRVEPGRFYDINRLAVDEDASITIDKVLLVNDGDDTNIGQPLVDGASVTGTVVRHLRGKKVIVYKMKPKKKTRKKRGHRQELTRLMIDSIKIGGKTITAEDVPAVSDAAGEEE